MCFALRLHTSAAPPRVGLTQALGGKKHSAVALSALQLVGFGQHCSSVGSWARCFFGQVCCARSHVACVALLGFGSRDRHLRVLPRLRRCFGHGRLIVRGTRSIVWASVFGQRIPISASRGSFAPNKSFKPTPHRGVNSVLYATLHAVATPPWGGLTPALAFKSKHDWLSN
jgi:hypothetical protein